MSTLKLSSLYLLGIILLITFQQYGVLHINVYFIVASIGIFLFLFRKESNIQISHIKFRPIHLFLISYVIVFFQNPVDYLYGYDGVKFPKHVSLCLSYATEGLFAFMLGYLSINTFKRPMYIGSFHKSYTASPVLFAFLTSLFVILILVTTPLAILLGGYSNDLLNSASTYNYLTSWCITFIIGFFVQFSLSQNSEENYGISVNSFIKKIGIWQNLNIIVYSIIILNIGDRGPLIIFATVYYITYLRVSHKSPSFKFLFIVGGFIFLFISILGLTKELRDNNTIFDRFSILSVKYESESVFKSTKELANSYRCLEYAVENVPTNDDFKYGEYQLGYILSVIPFSSRFVNTAGSSSTQITEYVYGKDSIAGTGTSILADFYLDGGILFILIGMFIFGRFIRLFELNVFCQFSISLFVYCLSIYMLSRSIYFPRAAFLASLKYAVWLYFVIYIYNKIKR